MKVKFKKARKNVRPEFIEIESIPTNFSEQQCYSEAQIQKESSIFHVGELMKQEPRYFLRSRAKIITKMASKKMEESIGNLAEKTKSFARKNLASASRRLVAFQTQNSDADDENTHAEDGLKDSRNLMENPAKISKFEKFWEKLDSASRRTSAFYNQEKVKKVGSVSNRDLEISISQKSDSDGTGNPSDSMEYHENQLEITSSELAITYSEHEIHQESPTTSSQESQNIMEEASENLLKIDEKMAKSFSKKILASASRRGCDFTTRGLVPAVEPSLQSGLSNFLHQNMKPDILEPTSAMQFLVSHDDVLPSQQNYKQQPDVLLKEANQEDVLETSQTGANLSENKAGNSMEIDGKTPKFPDFWKNLRSASRRGCDFNTRAYAQGVGCQPDVGLSKIFHQKSSPTEVLEKPDDETLILNDDENQPDSKQIDHLAANLKEKHQELMATTSQASQKGDGKTMKNHEIFDEKMTKSFFGKNLARAFGRPCANPTPELPTECIYKYLPNAAEI